MARWLLVILLLGGCFRSDPAPYTPRDPRLAAFPLYFYPSPVAPRCFEATFSVVTSGRTLGRTS